MSIPPNPRRVGYILPIHGASICGLTYTPTEKSLASTFVQCDTCPLKLFSYNVSFNSFNSNLPVSEIQASKVHS